MPAPTDLVLLREEIENLRRTRDQRVRTLVVDKGFEELPAVTAVVFETVDWMLSRAADRVRYNPELAAAFVNSAQAELNKMMPEEETAWRQRTPAEQEQLATAQIEEVHDCAKELAHEILDAMDAEEVADMLRVLQDDED